MKYPFLLLILLMTGCSTLDKKDAGKITTIGSGVNDTGVVEADYINGTELVKK